MDSGRARATPRVLGGLALCWVILLAGPTPHLPAAERYSANTLLKYTAKNVATFLRDYEKETVAIEIQVPPAMKGAGSNAFLQVLSEQLAAEKIKVAPKADFTVLVRCKPAGGERLAVDLSAQMIDSLGEVVHKEILHDVLTDATDLLRYFGLTGQRRVDGDFAIDAIKKPQVFLRDGRQARAGRGSTLGVEVAVRGRARPLSEESGYCYARLDLNEEYTIRLVNDSRAEMLAAVLVDGLSVFHFSEERATDEERKGEPKYRFYVVGPNETVTVEGWEVNLKKVRGFKITPPDESAAGKLGKADAVGVISVQFFDCKRASDRDVLVQRPQPRPDVVQQLIEAKDERGKLHRLIRPTMLAAETTTVGTRVGTGFGTEKIGDFQAVQRWVGPLREVVSIHYKRPE